MATQRVTRRSFVTSVGAASVLPAAAVLGETQVTAPGKESSTNAAATATEFRAEKICRLESLLSDVPMMEAYLA